jgi:hypothetical protein
VAKRCEDCGGRLDRPGLADCDGDHPEPTPAQQLAAKIEADISDRRGFKSQWAAIDPDTRDSIRDAWAEIARPFVSGTAADAN